jgi:hypothetical protein
MDYSPWDGRLHSDFLVYRADSCTRISCIAALADGACAVPSSRDRMQYGGPTKLNRKSGGNPPHFGTISV